MANDTASSSPPAWSQPDSIGPAIAQRLLHAGVIPVPGGVARSGPASGVGERHLAFVDSLSTAASLRGAGAAGADDPRVFRSAARPGAGWGNAAPRAASVARAVVWPLARASAARGLGAAEVGDGADAADAPSLGTGPGPLGPAAVEPGALMRLPDPASPGPSAAAGFAGGATTAGGSPLSVGDAVERRANGVTAQRALPWASDRAAAAIVETPARAGPLGGAADEGRESRWRDASETARVSSGVPSTPFGRSLSTAGWVAHRSFDRLRTNGVGGSFANDGGRPALGMLKGDEIPRAPFGLSLSKSGSVSEPSFDRLRTNGVGSSLANDGGRPVLGMLKGDEISRAPFGLSLSKPGSVSHRSFDRLRTNGVESSFANDRVRPTLGMLKGDEIPRAPFGLSLSKFGSVSDRSFDRLRTNGVGGFSGLDGVAAADRLPSLAPNPARFARSVAVGAAVPLPLAPTHGVARPAVVDRAGETTTIGPSAAGGSAPAAAWSSAVGSAATSAVGSAATSAAGSAGIAALGAPGTVPSDASPPSVMSVLRAPQDAFFAPLPLAPSNVRRVDVDPQGAARLATSRSDAGAPPRSATASEAAGAGPAESTGAATPLVLARAVIAAPVAVPDGASPFPLQFGRAPDTAFAPPLRAHRVRDTSATPPSSAAAVARAADAAPPTASLLDPSPAAPASSTVQHPNPPAPHGATTIDVDDLIERACQAVFARLVIEHERRGFARWA